MAVPAITSGSYELVLEADAITGKVDGDAVATWSDTSGLGHDATQATGSLQPLYKTNILNGLPVLRGDGTDDFMSVAGITGNDTTRTLFIVVKATSGTGRAFGLADRAMTYSPSNWQYNANEAFGDVNFGVSATAAFSVLGVRWNSTASADLFAGTDAVTNFDPHDGYAVDGSTLVIGAHTGGTSPLNGDIASVIVVDAAVSETDRQAIINYLGNKYALPVFTTPQFIHPFNAIPFMSGH